LIVFCCCFLSDKRTRFKRSYSPPNDCYRLFSVLVDSYMYYFCTRPRSYELFLKFETDFRHGIGNNDEAYVYTLRVVYSDTFVKRKSNYTPGFFFFIYFISLCSKGSKYLKKSFFFSTINRTFFCSETHRRRRSVRDYVRITASAIDRARLVAWEKKTRFIETGSVWNCRYTIASLRLSSRSLS